MMVWGAIRSAKDFGLDRGKGSTNVKLPVGQLVYGVWQLQRKSLTVSKMLSLPHFKVHKWIYGKPTSNNEGGHGQRLRVQG